LTFSCVVAAEGSLGGLPVARHVDLAGQGEAALPVADAEALGDVTQDVDPACLAGDGGVDEVQGGMQSAVAVGRDLGDQDEAALGAISGLDALSGCAGPGGRGPPEGGGVLDLLPQVGYGQFGQGLGPGPGPGHCAYSPLP